MVFTMLGWGRRGVGRDVRTGALAGFGALVAASLAGACSSPTLDDGVAGVGGIPFEPAGGSGSGGDPCGLPAEGGSGGTCGVAFLKYTFDSADGQCVWHTYSGCNGTANLFDTYAECRATCDPGQSEAACQVQDGWVYSPGATDVPDPTSCNTCTCNDGALEACTEEDCPEPCAEGTELATQCTDCGPTDACLIVETGCLPICDEQPDCDAAGGGVCLDGVCRTVCG